MWGSGRKRGGLSVRFCGAVLVLALAAGATSPTEYELKAAYLLNILRFSEPREPRSPGFLTLGIHAAGPIEHSMRTMEGSALHGRKLRVRTVGDASDLSGCDVVFLGRSNGAAARILDRARAAGLLTVGNDPSFIPMGGMMALVAESRSIVVEIDKLAVTAAGWTLSSHLLEVARIVKGAAR